jgi:molecular chaperone DnaK
VEAENNAEAVIFQSKKMLEEFKDKVDVDTKKNIESKISELEEERKSGDAVKINAKIEELNKIVQEIGTKMYQEAAAKAQSEQAASADSKDSGSTNSANEGNNKETVVDAEFKEKKVKKEEGKAA